MPLILQPGTGLEWALNKKGTLMTRNGKYHTEASRLGQGNGRPCARVQAGAGTLCSRLSDTCRAHSAPACSSAPPSCVFALCPHGTRCLLLQGWPCSSVRRHETSIRRFPGELLPEKMRGLSRPLGHSRRQEKDRDRPVDLVWRAHCGKLLLLPAGERGEGGAG